MCLICIELDKSTMTPREARRALGEMRIALDPTHVDEVEAKVVEAERSSQDAASEPDPSAP